MSKHIFKQTLGETDYEIQIGWDKPLQQYYGAIFAEVEEEIEAGKIYYDEIVWMNIFTPVVYSLEEIAREITQRGFTIPNRLLENVREDCINNMVNKFQHYDIGLAEQEPCTPIVPSL